jgi:hypothetical protein
LMHWHSKPQSQHQQGYDQTETVPTVLLQGQHPSLLNLCELTELHSWCQNQRHLISVKKLRKM